MRPEELIPGNFYFLISYYAENDEVPNIETLIFKEMLRERKGEDLWIFQYPGSSEQSDEDIQEIGIDEKQLSRVLDLKGLQNALVEMEDFYPSLDLSKLAQTNRTDFYELEKKVDEFLATERVDSLIITIRYKEKGISLVKRNGEIEAHFYIHWKIDPEREKRTRTFFQNRKLSPLKDYTARRPRIRLLTYTLPDNNSAVVEIVVNTFKEIYEMKNSDEFRFSMLNISEKLKKKRKE